MAVALVSTQANGQVAPVEGAESLYGYRLFDGDQLSIWVRSTGCTDASDFTIQLQGGQIAILRDTADNCRRKPFIAEVTLQLPGSDRELRLVNPVLIAGR